MSEEKFWLCVWGMVLSFLTVVALCITFNAHGKRDKWEKAVSNGADPMVVACALDGAEHSGGVAICVMLAQGRNAK